jgi:WbqC-like protein family
LKVAIHQPHYFPYPGFFHKLSLADTFVIMDEAQYDRRFTNRNRILDPHGVVWLSVPIEKADKFRPVREVRINNALPWREEHWKKVLVSYANASYFKLYVVELKEFYEASWISLFDLDLATTRKVLEWLGIKIKIILESDLGVTSSATQRLVDICKAVGADTYVSGRGAKEYMDESLFASNGLSLEYQQYYSRPYPQRFGGSFVPDLSILDAVFNLGPGTLDYIRENSERSVPSSAS